MGQRVSEKLERVVSCKMCDDKRGCYVEFVILYIYIQHTHIHRNMSRK